MAVHLTQDGLGLPERDFYFNPERGVARVRAEYVAHIARTLELLGRDSQDAETDASSVLRFETALAKALTEARGIERSVQNYNRMTPAELTTKYTPSIPGAIAWRRGSCTPIL